MFYCSAMFSVFTWGFHQLLWIIVFMISHARHLLLLLWVICWFFLVCSACGRGYCLSVPKFFLSAWLGVFIKVYTYCYFISDAKMGLLSFSLIIGFIKRFYLCCFSLVQYKGLTWLHVITDRLWFLCSLDVFIFCFEYLLIISQDGLLWIRWEDALLDLFILFLWLGFWLC